MGRALVDSGADHSLMPLSWLPTLGLRVGDCREEPVITASGVGRMLQNEATVDVEIIGRSRATTIRAWFAEGVPFMLLGRADFFRAFRVVFDERAQTVALAGYDDAPSLPFAA
jgi:hypothetical protein